MFRVKKKNLIALALVTVLLASGIGVYQVKAAKQVDVTKTVTITANVEAQSEFASNFAQYNGTGSVTVDLYKIADVKQSGELGDALVKGVDLSVLKGSKVTVADVKKKIVEPAMEAVEAGTVSKLQKSITVPMTGNNKYKGSVDIEKGAGVYLYVPKDVQDERYIYHFTPYVIMVPNSEYITATKTIVDENGNTVEESLGKGSDDWQYAASFNLKAEAEHRYGYVEIEKQLDRFNRDLGTASFVYEVKAQFDGKDIYSNYYSINFNEPGEGYAASGSEAIKLPAGATFTVKEVYAGASYEEQASKYLWAKKVVDDEETTRDVTRDVRVDLVEVDPIVIADDYVIADFENDYDNELQVGATSIENNYKLVDGSYIFNKNNLKPTQEPIQEPIQVEPDQPN